MTLSRKELIDLMAEAIGATKGKDGCPVGAHVWDVDLANAAKSALSVLDQAGMVIVPREPTEAMIAEGEGAWSTATAYQYSGVREAWEAMIDEAEAALTEQQI